MSLKQEIETWVNALEYYDKNDYESALKTFDGIADTSRILFNCGVIHATLGEHDKAVECYQKAVGLDKYLAIAYFQQGVSNFLVGDFEEALANFNDTLLYLRGNRFIDYDQLGLKFKLYSCEALFNRGLCYIYLQNRENGMNDLIYAAKEKETQDHDVIDEAIKENAEGYTVFSIPVGVVYRPNASKVKNLKTKDYLGKARLIASTDKANAHVNFHGSEQKSLAMSAVNNTVDERDPASMSFAASNLVRPELTSRARQQSEPPLNRSVFPPTPPPEEAGRYNSGSGSSGPTSARSVAPSVAPSDSVSLTSRANSIRSGAAPYRVPIRTQAPQHPTLPEEEIPAPPPPNNLPVAAFNPNNNFPGDESIPFTAAPDALRVQQRPRVGTIRTGSEPPRMRDETALSPRSRGMQQQQKQRLYGEVMEDPHDADTEELDEEANDELFELYNETASSNPYARPSVVGRERSTTRAQSRSRRDRSTSRRPSAATSAARGDSIYPEEIDGTPSLHSSLEDFEMLNGPPQAGGRGVPASLQTGHRRNMSEAPRSQALSTSTSSHSRAGSYAAPVGNTYMAYGNSNNVDVSNFRVKIHYKDESRYLMITAAATFLDFERKAKDKLKISGDLRIKMRDEEDPEELITLGDADDWDLALEASRKSARKSGDETGRLEVWLTDA